MSNLVSINSLPSVQEFQTMKDLGTMAVKSGFLPTSINTPEKAVIIMLKGRELGIPPMQAFSSIAVVNGKPTMSAELMLSMIYKNVAGAIVNFDVTDSKKCEISAKRPNGKTTKFSFTMEDAKTAGLTGKGPWVTYPAAMLRARCISAMARAMFPDALSGVVYTPEELGAEIDDDGNVLEVLAPEKPVVEALPEAPAAPQNPLAAPSDLGQYVVTFGEFKNQKLIDIDIMRLEKYLTWTIENVTKKKLTGERIMPAWVEFIGVAEPFLKSREFDRDLGFDTSEEIK